MEAGAPHARSTAQSRRQFTSHMRVRAATITQLQGEGKGEPDQDNERKRAIRKVEAERRTSRVSATHTHHSVVELWQRPSRAVQG